MNSHGNIVRQKYFSSQCYASNRVPVHSAQRPYDTPIFIGSTLYYKLLGNNTTINKLL